MIKGKAKIEFGTGSVMTIPVVRADGLAALCFHSVEPTTEVGIFDLDEPYNPADADVILTFSNEKSISLLIEMLTEMWRMKRGTLPVNYDKVLNKGDLDFDSFLADAK